MAVDHHFSAVSYALHQIDRTMLDQLARHARAMKLKDGTIWLAGNGGSFATAMHWAADLTKAAGMRAHALGTNGTLLTAYANDDGYADALVGEFRSWAKPGDMLVGLSCSGSSPNITRLIAAAKEMKIVSFLMTATVSAEVAQADYILRVWSQDYPVIEDCHSIIGHWLTKELS